MLTEPASRNIHGRKTILVCKGAQETEHLRGRFDLSTELRNSGHNGLFDQRRMSLEMVTPVRYARGAVLPNRLEISRLLLAEYVRPQ